MKKSSSVPVKSEVPTSPERRRRRAPAEKLAMVEETYAPGHTVSYVARKHGLNPSQLFNWRRAYEGVAMSGIEAEDKVVPAAEMKKLQERIRRLERLLGQKTEDVEILEEAHQNRARKKTDIACAVGRCGRFPVAAVARVLDVARSNLIEQLKKEKPKMPRTMKKADDFRLLPEILAITGSRPTYGYRRARRCSTGHS